MSQVIHMSKHVKSHVFLRNYFTEFSSEKNLDICFIKSEIEAELTIDVRLAQIRQSVGEAVHLTHSARINLPI